MAVFGVAYMFWNVVEGFIYGNLVPGYASLIGIVVTLGGCQLAFIGLIGEYLARVFEEVKGRPTYLVKQIPDSTHRAENQIPPQVFFRIRIPLGPAVIEPHRFRYPVFGNSLFKELIKSVEDVGRCDLELTAFLLF